MLPYRYSPREPFIGKRHRGAQKGNQNARKHGFYSRVLPASAEKDLIEAIALSGLENEIAVLRLKLRDLLKNHPDRVDLQVAAASAIARLMRTQKTVAPSLEKNMVEGMAQMARDVGMAVEVLGPDGDRKHPMVIVNPRQDWGDPKPE